MKHIIAILLLTGLGASVFAQVSPPKKTFYFQKNAKIAITTYDSVVVDPKIESGDKLVFFYEWQSAKNPQIADADRTDKLFFELTPEQAKSFTARGAELAKAGTIRCRICFCLEGGCRHNTKGELTVKKVGCGKYAVRFRDDPESEKYLVNETFSLKSTKP